MALDRIKSRLGSAAGAAGEKAKVVGGIVADKAVDAGSHVAEKAVMGKEKAAQVGLEARVRFYNPRFREDFFDPEFDLPGIIVIADGDERKGIDVCEGAIGWLTKHRGTEVLHLYREFVEESGLDFHPRPLLGAVYQVDAFDHCRFIDLSCIFEVAHKDRITELRNIAYDLGARRCVLESYELKKEVAIKKTGKNAKGNRTGKAAGKAVAGVALESQDRTDRIEELGVVFEQTFSGNATPHRPSLNWYKGNREIQSLINMRCSREDGNVIHTYRIEIDGSSSTTMARSHARRVDSILKDLKAECNFSMESECMSEARKKLKFTIEF